MFWFRRWFWFAGVTAVCACLAFVSFAVIQRQADDEAHHPPAIVAKDGTVLKRGNGDSYPRHPTLPTLGEGMETRRLAERGNWVQLEFAGGQIGWTRKDAVLFAE